MTATAYRNVRARMADVLADATAADLARTVPACPNWTVHDLVAHAVGIPEAL
ncbi:MAG: maleylpyruvate isomerase N-terminal domain-containing protein, partial [Actinomycetes bacterium]